MLKIMREPLSNGTNHDEISSSWSVGVEYFSIEF